MVKINDLAYPTSWLGCGATFPARRGLISLCVDLLQIKQSLYLRLLNLSELSSGGSFLMRSRRWSNALWMAL